MSKMIKVDYDDYANNYFLLYVGGIYPCWAEFATT